MLMYNDQYASNNSLNEPIFTNTSNTYSTITWDSNNNMTKPTEAQIITKYDSIKSDISLDVLKQERDRLLKESDKFSLKDYPHKSITKRREWEEYRRSLRDITSQTPTINLSSFELGSINFPTIPSDEVDSNPVHHEPLEWTASSSTHSYNNLTITTSSNSTIGYIRSTNSLKGSCMLSFKIYASGGTAQFYVGLATDIANENNFPSYSEHSYFQIWDNGYAYLWEIGNNSSSKSTVSTTNRDHRYTIIYTGTSLKFYLDNILQTTVSRNANLEHFAMFKFNPGHTSISEYDIKLEKVDHD